MQPKIAWKAVGRKLAFSVVDEGYYLTAPASFISAGDKTDLIISYLRSNVGTYYIYKTCDTTGAGDIMLNIQSLVRFPIPYVKEFPRGLTEAEKELFVFESYGFSQEEIEYIKASVE